MGDTAHDTPRFNPYAVLIIGIIGVSTGSIFDILRFAVQPGRRLQSGQFNHLAILWANPDTRYITHYLLNPEGALDKQWGLFP